VQTFELQFPARSPALPEKVGGSTNSALQQLRQYTNSHSLSQTHSGRGDVISK